VEQYIQRGNIALFRKRLLEPNNVAARQILLKLLAAEEAKGDPLESCWPARWLQSELKSPK
jgi:hypothetical protein